MRHGMTAFARVYRQTNQHRIQIEIRSVNHRYLEIAPRIGEQWRHLESSMREHLQKRLKRGKIDFWLSIENSTGAAIPDLNDNALRIWRERLSAYRDDQLPPPDWHTLLALPGVLNNNDSSDQPQDDTIMTLFSDACTQLIAARASEGSAMSAVISNKLDLVNSEIHTIRDRYPEVQAGIENNLRDKITALRIDIDQQRFEQELVYLLARADIAEELDRLSFHINETRTTLNQPGAVGRRLDFLMQEFNREANTLGAKSNDPIISRAAVNLKVLIEQMREQVQNIE